MQTSTLPGQSLALQQVLSPQLQQSLLVLQTPLLELRNLVQQEMETNPVLEELPDEPSPDAQGESELPLTIISRANSRSWRASMKNGAITWRSRPTPARTAFRGHRKRKISASSFSIPSPCRKRFSKICWDN